MHTSSLKYEIKEVKVEDLPFLYASYLSYSKDKDKKLSAERFVRRIYRRAIEKKESPAWVAVIKETGELVGFLVLDIFEHDYETPALQASADLVYVTKKHRGKGAAELLTEKAISFVKEAGIDKIAIFMLLHNGSFNKMLEKKFNFKIKMSLAIWEKENDKE